MGNKPKSTSYFLKAARRFYFIAVLSFTACLILNQPVYFRNSWLEIIVLDSVSVIIVCLTLLLYIRNIIGLKLSSAVFVYTTLLNIALSCWYYYFYAIHFAGNFLLSTLIYCINVVVAGFCIGRRHAFIAAGFYVVFLLPLVFISRDDFLTQNVITLFLLIVAFAFAVSGFLYALESTHNEELALREVLFKKDQDLVREQNKFLNYELEARQKEIVAKTLFLIEYAKNYNTLFKKLNNLKDKLGSPEQRILNETIQNHCLDHHEKYWKEFEASFLEIRQDFYRNLKKTCPDLSPAELKLAALIHLGLSSKQISSITLNTVESVDVSRSRLRSKLNLPADVNLQNFLLNI
jgi:hypothetical protein